MLMTFINKAMITQIDKMILFTMNRRVPNSLEESYHHAPTFENVLEQTWVDSSRTIEYQLSAPGEHPIWLHTMEGELLCQVRVKPAVSPEAPLVLYHHGFNEIPYTNSWRRIFRRPSPFPAHTVCVQAPYHDSWIDPFDKGMASLQSIYQTFAGSLRIMELVQSHFESHGSAYTVAAGTSWGGITSMVYEGVFNRTRAVIPMLASPNLAQVMWDIATLFDRPIPISRAALGQYLDFTPYYQRCDPNLVFPLLGENDQFFRYEHHADLFAGRRLTTIPEGHITGSWKANQLRRHILDVLSKIEAPFANG